MTSVIALVSIGQGATSKVTEQIQSLGSNLLTVNIMGRGANTTLRYDQAMEFANSPNISAVAPVITGNITVKHANKNSSVQVQGTNGDFLTVRSYQLSKGRFIAHRCEHASKVATWFPNSRRLVWLGRTGRPGNKMGGQTFKVIGILNPQAP